MRLVQAHLSPFSAPLLPVPALDEIVPASTRRLAEWAVYGLCGGAATLALCLTFGIRIFSLQ